MARTLKAAPKAVKKGQKRDAKTGKVVKKSVKLMRADKAAGLKKRHRVMSAEHKMKIAKALRKSFKTGKTKSGRPRFKTGPKPKAGGAKKIVAKKPTGAKRGRPAKAAAAPAKKRGRPAGVKKSVAKPGTAKKRGRPAGSTNKPKVANKGPGNAKRPAAPKRGRPAKAKVAPKATKKPAGKKRRM